MITIDFSFETKYGRFADALCLPEDHGFSDEELQTMKQQRLDNWLAIIENPPIIEELPITGDLQG